MFSQVWFQHLFTPAQTSNQIAAGIGAFVSLVATRRFGWAYVLTLILVGQVTAFYFTVPIALWFHISLDFYPVIAFTIGIVALGGWLAVIRVVDNLQADPQGTLTWLLRIVRGASGGDNTKDGGVP